MVSYLAFSYFGSLSRLVLFVLFRAFFLLGYWGLGCCLVYWVVGVLVYYSVVLVVTWVIWLLFVCFGLVWFYTLLSKYFVLYCVMLLLWLCGLF